VQTGWQVAFRSKNLLGPYEEKIVLEQGTSSINGPHQGALVDLPDGSWWFLHFQDCGPFGRIVHLQPVHWQDGWPLMGEIQNAICQPVARWKKPVLGFPPAIPKTSDSFSEPTLGLQWQWHANHDPSWFSLTENPGSLRLYPGVSDSDDISEYPRFLGQKFPARQFWVRVGLNAQGMTPGGIAGLGITSGNGSHFLGMRRNSEGWDLVLRKPGEVELLRSEAPSSMALAVGVGPDGQFQFYISSKPGSFEVIPESFEAKEGGWIGARVGLFHLSESEPAGYADFASFQFSGDAGNASAMTPL
jgi:beta-xylosidase